MKYFMGLGSTAWIASAAVHVGLAGGYALAPTMSTPVSDAPLVIELVVEQQPDAIQETGATNSDAAAPLQAEEVTSTVSSATEPVKMPQSAKEVTPDLPEPSHDTAPMKVQQPDVVPEMKVAIAAPVNEFPQPSPQRIEPPKPVSVPAAEVLPEFPAPVDSSEVESVEPEPLPEFEIADQIALLVPSISETSSPPVEDQIIVRLPKEKPLVPERPDETVVERQANIEEPAAAPELTLDQIASNALVVPEEEVKPVEEPVKSQVSEATVDNSSSEEVALVPPDILNTSPKTDARQLASAVSPVIVRAGRIAKVVSDGTVAKSKGRGAYRPAKMLPVGSVNAKPRYPYSARKRGHEGRVVLHIEIAADGKPQNVSIVDSTGYKSLDNAAIKAVMGWQFEAAQRAGVRIAGTVVTPIVFRLEN